MEFYIFENDRQRFSEKKTRKRNVLASVLEQ